MNNPLALIPAAYRKYLYAAYALAGIVVGTLAAAGVDVAKAPDVLAYLAPVFGAVAVSNVDEGYGDGDEPLDELEY